MGVCEFPAAELKYLQVDLGKHFCDVAHNTFLLSTLELCLEPQNNLLYSLQVFTRIRL